MKKYIILLLMVLIQTGCKKYLDEKPNMSLALPKDNLDNLQLLLNDTHTMNQQAMSAGEVGTDNFYLTDAELTSLSQSQPTSGNLYIWNRDLFNDNDNNDWTLTYKVVFNANLVLDALKDITPSSANQDRWNTIKGEALFFRAYSFYQLLQEFAKPYDKSTAFSDLGISLRLTSDVSDKSTRASVQQSYDQITEDLKNSVSLLPATAQFKTIPYQVAAIGLLARVNLTMGNYQESLNYTNSYLKVSPTLLDYNKLSGTASFPLARYNVEVNFHSTLYQIGAYSTSYGRVDDNLFASYNANDLRKTIFFRNGGVGNITFKGSYDGSHTNFAGISTDEIYLINAECQARLGNISNAMNQLNLLMSNRWRTGTFTPFTANDMQTALKTILAERRKELVYRNIRWSDLRRLNKDPSFQTTINRSINGKIYSLNPNDIQYVLPLPNKVVQLSGMIQN